MSDITPEIIEAAKSRDQRLRLIGDGIAVEAELRDSPTIKALMAAVERDAYAALEEMADLAPTDLNAVSKAIVNARTLVYMRRSLDSLLRRAENAMHEVRAQDIAGLDERD